MRPSAFLPACMLLLGAPCLLRAQAMAEYALGAARSTGSGGGMGVGGCRINADLFSCLNQNHPTTTIAVIVLLCLLLVWWLAGSSRSRSY